MLETNKPLVFSRFFGVRLTEDLRTRLADHIQRYETTASETVREALANYFTERSFTQRSNR